ncbi:MULTISPECIES: endonuclease III [Clostridium]|uniref:Endonuclease III n=1 Tax=Clostridium cadaveris TaxID=1529 RepID=A0A1I2KE23_9CLOT|nr:endonuclease III [Clostridium cadaveris]MDU4952095.1 endonuclease III [Clostridium sp.]MDM8310588.1 endonuclease III [Clostridium cadaveris]MDY4949676.1 endonuclease III [Clostridium cadaveris]NME65139.1 endonuclease III [Clostridium cadaveris]NWK11403.1 endonuclease III [Clostridium cadaveris]
MRKNPSEEKVNGVLNILKELYPDAKCELNYGTAFQLLVATALSAQTTDKKVNSVTETLFKEYPDADAFLTLTQEELEEKIKTIGLYRNKAKNLLKMCQQLKENFNGQVPDTMEGITSLAGAGRKTANVVLSNAFGVPAIAVDTHVFRVSNRIGLAHAKNVEDTEKQLQNNIPKEEWSLAHHLIIFHGRRCCYARKPDCENCALASYCDYFEGAK